MFIIPIAVQWWSVWYPGAEPGGGGGEACGAGELLDAEHRLLRPYLRSPGLLDCAAILVSMLAIPHEARLWLLSSLALELGGVLYVLFRPWGLGLPGDGLDLERNELTDFLVRSGPDFMWALALTAALGAIWLGRSGLPRNIWIAVPLSLGCLWELAQYGGLLAGTGDWRDVVGYSAGWALALWAARTQPTTAGR